MADFPSTYPTSTSLRSTANIYPLLIHVSSYDYVVGACPYANRLLVV